MWPALPLLDPQGKVVVNSPPLLRSVAAEMAADGSTKPVNGLDWALQSLFDKN